MTAAFRCSADSAGLAEPQEGTASTVRAFLLLEAPGPWGVNAVRDGRLPEEVRRRLVDLETRHRVRPLLIRRYGRTAVGSPTVFAASVDPQRPWVETTTLDDVRELLDLDLDGLGAGLSPGLMPRRDQLFLACTHGRHDACCAERGRPLAAALARSAAEQTWEVSHIGGDRFAANVLVLPHGLYYGRLTPQDAPAFVERHMAGRLDLEHVRGRSSYPFSVQAAEIYLRRHTRLDAVGPPRLEEHTRQGANTRVVFGTGGERWEVRVRTELGDPRRLTCSAPAASPPLGHELLEIRRVP